jgi:hypothetical protein
MLILVIQLLDGKETVVVLYILVGVLLMLATDDNDRHMDGNGPCSDRLASKSHMV